MTDDTDFTPDRIGTKAYRPRDEGHQTKGGKIEFHRDRPRCRGRFLYGLLTLSDTAELARRLAKGRAGA